MPTPEAPARDKYMNMMAAGRAYYPELKDQAAKMRIARMVAGCTINGIFLRLPARHGPNLIEVRLCDIDKFHEDCETARLGSRPTTKLESPSKLKKRLEADQKAALEACGVT